MTNSLNKSTWSKQEEEGGAKANERDLEEPGGVSQTGVCERRSLSLSLVEGDAVKGDCSQSVASLVKTGIE